MTQLGTEAAVLVYFRRDIGKILRTWTLSLARPALRREPAARLGWYVILGTMPIAALGLAFQSTIETTLRDLRIVGVSLIVFGVVLGVADRVARNYRPVEQLTLRHALAFGVAQPLRWRPGLSRSGGTISAGLLLGYTCQAAARYSFLLAVPAVLASGLLDIGRSQHSVLGADPAGHRSGFRTRLRRDRRVVALPGRRQLPTLRALPHSPRAGRPDPGPSQGSWTRCRSRRMPLPDTGRPGSSPVGPLRPSALFARRPSSPGIAPRRTEERTRAPLSAAARGTLVPSSSKTASPSSSGWSVVGVDAERLLVVMIVVGVPGEEVHANT